MPSISLKTSIKTLIFNTSICILIYLKLLNISSTNLQLKSHLQILNPFCWIGIKQKHFVFQWSILIGECCYYGCENGPQLCLPVYGTHWIFIAVYNNTRNQWLRSSTLPSCCYIYLIKYLKRPTSFWKCKSLYKKGSLSTTILYKTTDSHSYLDYHWSHNPSNIPFSQFLRPRCLFLNDADLDENADENYWHNKKSSRLTSLNWLPNNKYCNLTLQQLLKKKPTSIWVCKIILSNRLLQRWSKSLTNHHWLHINKTHAGTI